MEEEEKYVEQIKKETDVFIKARLLNLLKKEKGWRVIDLSKRLNLKPSYICHLLRLNRLPEIVVDGYYNKMISKSHLFVLSRLPSEKEMIKVYELILEKNLDVSKTEDLVREIVYQIKNEGDYLSLEEKEDLIKKIESLEENIKAKVIQTRVKGKLIIEIKGSLKKTSKILRKIKRLIEINRDL
jgi:hypothetical protein